MFGLHENVIAVHTFMHTHISTLLHVHTYIVINVYIKIYARMFTSYMNFYTYIQYTCKSLADEGEQFYSVSICCLRIIFT